jgi:iron complex transport system substrate-binding protein
VSNRYLSALAASLLALMLAACGGSGESGAPTTSSSAAEPPAAFPVTVTAADGELVLERAPERIVSLSPTATESLFAIGAGDQVVAVDDQSNHPAEAPRTDLSSFQPNVEAVAGFEPDLVVASFDPGGLVPGLGKLEIPVLLQESPTDLDGAYEQIETLGEATGHADEAAAVVEDMRSRIEELAASAGPEARGLTVYHEISPDFFSATAQTFIGSVYELLGLRNIADEAGGGAPDFPQLSAEYILDADPDVIVLADTTCCGQTAEKAAARPGWDTLSAIQEGNVVPVDDDLAARWGPRTVDFVEVVARALAEAGGS